MGFEEWFKKNSETAKKTVKEEFAEFKKDVKDVSKELKKEYDEATEKAGKARVEDRLAQKFDENTFVKAVLAGEVVFRFKEKKRVRSFFNNYEKSIWESGFECFQFILHHTTEGDLMEFKINHSPERFVNLYRLNNVIRHGVDKNDPEPKMGVYRFL